MLDNIYRRIDFWDSKISGKKKVAVDSKIIVLDDSGNSNFICKFQIPPHIFTLKQKSEDRFSLVIDNYKFKDLLYEEMRGNLAKLREESLKSPLDDVDKILKKQLEKEREEKERNKNLMKEISTKKSVKKEKGSEFISPKDIKEIKNNLENKNNENQVFEQNKQILKNISVFNDNTKPQKAEDFKKNSDMIGMDFFTGEFEGGNNNDNTNNNTNNNDNPLINKSNNNNDINNIKNAQNPHNQEVIKQLMNKIVPENKNENNNKELEALFDEFNGTDSDNDNTNKNSIKNNNTNNKKGENDFRKPNSYNFSSNLNKDVNNSDNNNIFNEVNNNFVKNNSNSFKPRNLEEEKRMNSTPFDFDDDDDIL